jgi:hypothetical protein
MTIFTVSFEEGKFQVLGNYNDILFLNEDDVIINEELKVEKDKGSGIEVHWSPNFIGIKKDITMDFPYDMQRGSPWGDVNLAIIFEKGSEKYVERAYPFYTERKGEKRHGVMFKLKNGKIAIIGDVPLNGKYSPPVKRDEKVVYSGGLLVGVKIDKDDETKNERFKRLKDKVFVINNLKTDHQQLSDTVFPTFKNTIEELLKYGFKYDDDLSGSIDVYDDKNDGKVLLYSDYKRKIVDKNEIKKKIVMMNRIYELEKPPSLKDGLIPADKEKTTSLGTMIYLAFRERYSLFPHHTQLLFRIAQKLLCS